MLDLSLNADAEMDTETVNTVKMMDSQVYLLDLSSSHYDLSGTYRFLFFRIDIPRRRFPPWHSAPTYIHRGAERLKPYHLSLAPVSASTFHLRACAHRATEGVLVPSAQGPASSIGRHPVEREGEAPRNRTGAAFARPPLAPPVWGGVGHALYSRRVGLFFIVAPTVPRTPSLIIGEGRILRNVSIRLFKGVLGTR